MCCTLGIPCILRVASVMTAKVPSDPINSRVKSYPVEYGWSLLRVYLDRVPLKNRECCVQCLLTGVLTECLLIESVLTE